jgi:bilirubin oxidase
MAKLAIPVHGEKETHVTQPLAISPQLACMNAFCTFRIVGFAGLLGATTAHAQSPLLLPEFLTDTEVTLTLDHGEHEFLPGVMTPTLGANGPVLGPVIEAHRGDVVTWNVVNNIGEITTMHWHGMHVAPENDGGPHSTIAPGETWSPSFEVLDKAGTYWYHPHLHMMTNAHVSKGIAGMIWVRDDVEQALTLPRTYGVDEFPLVLQTKAFDADGIIEPDSNTDDVAMVNATVDAVLDVPAQMLRFHVLNGSSQRVFNVGFDDDMTFQLIATEGGLIDAPVTTARMRLAPGERCEIVVDASGLEGQTLTLVSHASEFSNGIYGATNPGMGAGMSMTGYSPNPLNGADFPLLTLQVGPATDNAVTSLPEVLDPSNANPWNEADIDQARTITMSPVTMGMNQLNGEFLLNGAPFNMDVINHTIPLNNLETWTITNMSGIGHPFHIHDVQFYILDRDGVPPSAVEQGRKDVVFVPAMQTARFITAFEDFANPDIPYMYHCHMLTHEDGGMMGQFVVVDSDNVEEHAEHEAGVHPSPARHVVRFNSHGEPWRVVDMRGVQLAEGVGSDREERLDVSAWPNGMYLLHTRSESTETTANPRNVQRFVVSH